VMGQSSTPVELVVLGLVSSQRPKTTHAPQYRQFSGSGDVIGV
jgi:hypothetical protein